MIMDDHVDDVDDADEYAHDHAAHKIRLGPNGRQYED